jgi:hypothetical protein
MSILAVCCFGFALLTTPPEAAPPKDDVTYTVNSRRFMIPICISSSVKQENIDRLVLYYSSDKGRNWREVTKILPDQKQFRFTAPADGTYWFTVQVIYKDDTREPSVVDRAEPNLKVGVVTGGKAIGTTSQQDDLEREVSLLRKKVEKLEKRIAELEKQQKTEP